MSFLPHLLRLSADEQNEGAFLVWKCPQCQVEGDFELIVTRGGLSVAGLSLGKPETMLDLRCSKCRYEFKVAVAERGLLDQVREATRLLKAGALTPQTYVATVRETPARFVKDLLALSETWKCPKCGEANPLGFDTCWNCSSKGTAAEIPPESAEPYPGIPRGGNSWE
jgi:hypothetical protein